MKSNNICKIGVAACLSLSLVACTSDFDTINTDPNNPTKATPELMLKPLLRTLIQGQFNYGDGAGLAHHIARTNYNEVEQYAFGTNEGSWTNYYTQLNNIKEMITLSEKSSLPSSKAIAYILKAFVAAQLTDMWGDVPYSQATLGSDDITPAYDTQESIYVSKGGIIDLLKQADELLASSSDVMPSDLVYGGDREKWRKLGNSLRLRYLMRISNRIGETSLDIKSEIAEVASLPLMDSNDDNMLLQYLSGSPNLNPIYDMRSGNFEYTRMSDEMQRMWDEYSDPRVPVWFAPSTNSAGTDTPVYAGIPVGCSSTTLTNIGYDAASVSMLGDYFRATPDGCAAILMNCSEVKLLLAEAYVRGYANGDAKAAYEDGIRLSLEYYDVDGGYEAYISQPGIAYDESKALEQIMTQKWMSLFFVGYEGWYDFLRTGLPAQDQLHDNRNPSESGAIPSRFYYPEDEQALNTTNYNEAVKRQGGKDNINTELWWEKK